MDVLFTQNKKRSFCNTELDLQVSLRKILSREKGFQNLSSKKQYLKLDFNSFGYA
jgi:hypothetical protein